MCGVNVVMDIVDAAPKGNLGLRSYGMFEDAPRYKSHCKLMLFFSSCRTIATILLLVVEEAAVIQATGQRAGFGAAEDAVPPAGYGIVGGIAQRFR